MHGRRWEFVLQILLLEIQNIGKKIIIFKVVNEHFKFQSLYSAVFDWNDHSSIWQLQKKKLRICLLAVSVLILMIEKSTNQSSFPALTHFASVVSG